MPLSDRIADKTKAFFTGRRRSRNRNQASSGYGEGGFEQRPRPRTKGAGSGPFNSLPNQGVGTKNAVHPSVSEDVGAIYPSVHGAIGVGVDFLSLVSAALPPHAMLSSSGSPPVHSTHIPLYDPTSTPLPPPLDTGSASHAIQRPDQDARSLSSRPSTSNTPAHNRHTPANTSDYSTGTKSTPHTRDHETDPPESLPVTGGSTTSVVHLGASGSESGHGASSSAHAGVNAGPGLPSIPSAAVPPHVTSDLYQSPPVHFLLAGLHDAPSTPLPPLLGARMASHTVQHPDHNDHSESSRSSVSSTVARTHHTPVTASNSPFVAGGSATSVLHYSASRSEPVHDDGAVHSAVHGGINLAQSSPPLPPVVVPPHPAMRLSASLLSSASTQSAPHDPTPTSPSPLLNARPNSNVIQLPHQNARRPLPNPPLLNASAHNPHPPSTALNSDVIQLPHQNARRPLPNPPLLNAPTHNPHPPSIAPNPNVNQLPHQNARRPLPNPPLLNPPTHDPHPPSIAPNPNVNQLPHQIVRKPLPNPPLLNSPVHSPQPLSTTLNYFPNASGISIGQMNNTVHNFGSTRTVFDYLEPHISHGAAHNSDERSDAPQCDPETRQVVQEDIVSWMRHGDLDEDPKQILWLSGPAGSGKTAIAGSVAETCRKEGLLAATFFCSSSSGSEDRHSKRCIVPTLAHHLAGHPALHQYKIHLLAAIERQPDIFRKCLSDQARHLLIEPLREVKERVGLLKGIMLDGVDEVLAKNQPKWTPHDLERAHEDDQLEILNILLTLANDPAFPFRIFVASRPEQVICEFFTTTAKASTLTLFLDSKYKPDEDIRRFLESGFAGIRRRCGIPSALWPGQNAINQIVEMSSGQFIIPATVIRHVKAGVPQRQLEDVLQLKWEDTSRENPFATVDALYTVIFSRSLEPLLAAKWMRAYTISRHGLEISALYFRQLVEDLEGEFHHVLGPLSSLVSIPVAGDWDTPLKVYHKSLSDYLCSQHRCGDLYLNMSDVETFIADRCAIVLKNKGPAVPIQHSSDSLGQFLDEFYLTTMGGGLVYRLPSPGRDRLFLSQASMLFHRTLPHMSQDSRDLLTICDVAWWTRLCLTQSPYHTKHCGIAFITGLYCGMHCYSCSSDSPLTLPNCHAACSHWREGILAEAKALNRCVHELEQANLWELYNFRDPNIDTRFKEMGKQKDGSILSCTICQPMPSIM